MNKFIKCMKDNDNVIFTYFGIFIIAVIVFTVIFVLLNVFTWLPQYSGALVTLGTIAIAFTAFWNIRQAYKFRETDRKQRLLKEIIDWAERIVSLTAVDVTVQGKYLHKEELTVKYNVELNVLYAKKNFIIGITNKDNGIDIGESRTIFNKAISDFEENHTLQTIINCKESMLALIVSIGKYSVNS